MKIGFNTLDIVCSVTELQSLIGMRVNNVYDIDNKTYLVKLQRSEEKSTLLFESANRIHTTAFEWPKNTAPSGFSMKMRKHLKNKRLESLKQLGSDRIIDLQFGSGEAAYHIILELYSRGNIILTDYESTILNVLRPHVEGDKFKFAVREKYPLDRPRIGTLPTRDDLKGIFENAKDDDALKKVLVPHLDYGPPLIEHVLLKAGFPKGAKVGKDFKFDADCEKLLEALKEADTFLQNAKLQPSQGYIIQKREEKPTTPPTYFLSNLEFHPYLFTQFPPDSTPHQSFPTFNQAVDEFYSTVEGQRIELKTLAQEREAMKKLENVRRDHSKRLEGLEKTQEGDKQRAELITRNQEEVEGAIRAVQSALATQIAWEDIGELVKDAASKGDPIAKKIKQLKLEKNHISLLLSDPYIDEYTNKSEIIPTMVIDIDLALSAFANARRYYDQKRTAAKKQQKTIESQTKAFKSAEKKTKQILKDAQTISNINKARKVYWFEKFFWFVSSENYLVIAGRDQQQNEFIVKRYMRPKDIYVHADIHGASSVIIKNPSGLEVPPKTLNEAGTMAICYSVAWEAKVVTNSYWVFGEQVTKTAPTGEYLTTGSFMVRGKKNFLPPAHLILGLGFMFRLEEDSVARHAQERRVLGVEEEDRVGGRVLEGNKEEEEEDEEVQVLDESDEENDNNDDKKPKEEQQPDEIQEKEVSQENSDDNSSSEEEESKFPDTRIKMQHFQGTKVNILTESVQTNKSEIPGENVVFLGDANPVIVNNNQRSRTTSKSSNKSTNLSVKDDEEKKDEITKQQQAQSKRGQKSKLKKIKEKYRDQDDEERSLRMTILQSSGASKDSKKSKKNKEAEEKQRRKQQPRQPKQPTQNTQQLEDGTFVDEDEPQVQADVDMIDALTGLPVLEDEILFAVPVVAPYNTLSNYKYKVKLTPGTNRRGKAAKTAVNMFMHDKLATPREKDLLKAVKDDTLARNIPGKVKLSAPRLNASRK